MIITKLIRMPEPLAKAVKKAAHRKETNQHQLVLDLIAAQLDAMGDPAISALVDLHYREEAERALNKSNPEPEST